MKQILICLTLFLCTISNFHGQKKLDSLLNIKNACSKPCLGDTTKLILMSEMTGKCEMNEILNYEKHVVDLADAILSNERELTVKQKNRLLKAKANAISNGGVFYQESGDRPRALNAYSKCLKLFEEISDRKNIGSTLNNLALIFYFNGDFFKALEYFNQCLKIREELGDKKGIAMMHRHIAVIYKRTGNIATALDYYAVSLKLYEELADKLDIATVLNEIGGIYSDQGETQKALDIYNRSLKLRQAAGDKVAVANSLNNIGTIYFNSKKGDLNKALEYFNKALLIVEESGFKRGIAAVSNSMGNIYEKKGELQKAQDHYDKSLKIYEEIKDQLGVAGSFYSICKLLYQQKKYQPALSNVLNSFAIAKKLSLAEQIRDDEELMSKIYFAMKNTDDAFAHYKQFIVFKDSLNNEQTRKASIKHQLTYEFEKKETVIKDQQEKERALAKEKNQRQQITIGAVVFGLILVMIFAAFVFRSLKTTKHQKIIIEVKQKEILDSIHYAKRIQTALMTNEKYIARQLDRLSP